MNEPNRVRKIQLNFRMVLIGEFGSDEDNRAKDSDWTYLHIGLWSGIHTGSACVPMYWYHQELVETGYQSYLQPLHKCINAFDFVSEPLETAKFSRSSNVKAIGLTNESGTAAILYVYNAKYTWAAENPEPAQDASVTLKGLKADRVRIDLWDTLTGEIVRSEEKDVSWLGTVKIEFDSLAADAAVMIRSIDK